MSATSWPEDPFSTTRACLEGLVVFLEGEAAAALNHADLETEIAGTAAAFLQRLALQEHGRGSSHASR